MTHDESSEAKKVILMSVENNRSDHAMLDRFSNFNKMIRSIAYCLRFFRNCSHTNDRMTGQLSIDEIEAAKLTVIKLVQNSYFSREISVIQSKQQLSKSSKLQPLNPFIDDNGVFRVGGRIQNAHIPYAQKHPIILSAKAHFTDLLVESVHKKLLHAGPQSVISHLRLEFWPLGGRREIKRILHKCMTCFRYRATGLQQIMSPLPSTRVNSTRAFLHVGIDFAGPILIKQSRLRKTLHTKAYVALFGYESSAWLRKQCIIIELVSNLSTNNFILALKRFTSRRGLPLLVFSDNGTNLRGAHNFLNQIYDSIFSAANKAEIQNFFNDQKIQWNFIPPLASHHGGLWESNIKSIKTHLTRTLGSSLLTFEEMCTVLAQIEAILNSRPLTPLTEDPSELSYLTPGHFLIHAPLTALAENTVNEIPKNRLNFWKLCCFLQQSFWKKWSVEYLHQLQQRSKWRISTENIKLNTVVLIIDKNLPPQVWLLGRVVKLHVGNDGNIHAVDIFTKHGTFTRPIVKVAPLPFECNGTSE